MRTKKLLFSLSLILAAGITFTFFSSLKNSTQLINNGKKTFQVLTGNYSVLSTNITSFWKQNNASDILKESGGKPKGNKVKNKKAIAMEWIEMGSDNIGGRTRAVLVDKSNENLIFAGSVTGGLWKSTTAGLSWSRVTGGDLFDNLCVSSICQAANGDLYFGTGEYYATHNNIRGFRGQGIWKSTNRGVSWRHLTSTWNDTDNSKQIFYYVNKLASPANNSNKIYAATIAGLMVSNDSGATWSNPITDANANLPCTDVQVSTDGQVVVISLNNLAYVCNTGNDVFVNKSGTGSIPTAVGRIEFAVAPSNSNYIYCLAADLTGGLKNVYKSTDKGNTWINMLPIVNSQFAPFGIEKLGIYENSIAVFPDDYDHILVGGSDLYSWSLTNSWEQLTSNLSPYFYLKYIHSGIHTISFSQNYSSTNTKVYVGTDAGVFGSTYEGLDWTQLNKNYNTNQFHSVAFSNDGRVLGGSRNHGTIYFSLKGTTLQDATSIFDGDGGYCEYSMLNPNLSFATKKLINSADRYGILGRSEDNGENLASTYTDIFSPYLFGQNAVGMQTDTAYLSDIVPIRLWESFYDTNSTQTVRFIVPGTLHLNDTILVTSSCKRIINHIIDAVDLNGQDSLVKDDTIYIKDTYQSMLAIGLKNSIWITRQAVDMSKVPMFWYCIANTGTTVKKITTIEISSDGNYLYFADYKKATDSSIVYRCSNLTNGRDSLTGAVSSSGNMIQNQIIGSFSHKVTGLAVDPLNANNLVVTIGNYGVTDHIYYSNNAGTTTSVLTADNFVSKQGDLPSIPAYCAIVKWDNSAVVIVGTESGVYLTEDITASSPVWTSQNTSLANVPVLQLRQQIHRNGWMSLPIVGNGIDNGVRNHGIIYAATYGRGIFRCENFKTLINVPEITSDKINASQIIVYPNPVRDLANLSFTLNSRSKSVINIYNLNGNVVKTFNTGTLESGKQSVSFSTSGLSTGAYIVEIVNNGTKKTTRFVIY